MSEIKDAATIVLIRNYGSKAFVLMGKRSETATFMPSKYVFPGGVWEKQDNFVPLSQDMSEKQKQLLMIKTGGTWNANLGVTVIRELWEETGLRLSSTGKFENVPTSWEEFFFDNQGPDLSKLNFFFRAITPPGRPRRFDTRFFFCNARNIFGDLEKFHKASGELNDLQWIEIAKAGTLDLPKITIIAINRLLAVMAEGFKYQFIPFYSGGSDDFHIKKLMI